MRKPKIILLFFTAFFSMQCVETLITVRVFPSGEYHIKFHSEGNKQDIYNDDFNIPTNGKWYSETFEKKEESRDETIHIINSEAILNGATSFYTEKDGPAPQRHPISILKKDGLFSTTYSLSQTFEGRRVSQKYPLLTKSMQDVGNDSTDKIVETEIIMYCLRMGMDNLKDEMLIEELLKERILNHFRGVFYKAEEEGKLFSLMDKNGEIDNDILVLPKTLIKTNFKPFLGLLPKHFTEACMDAMLPYIHEANVTVGLNDDTFKFVGILPGEIIHSNADSISNDTLWWSFNYKDFINDDYVIEAASIVYQPKKVQMAIVMSALIILMGLILISKKRKKS